MFRALFLVFCALLASPAYAQAVETTLPPVIVTATRKPTLASQVASSVTVITSAEIEAKQRRTLPDILQEVPGLQVVQRGSPGAAASVFTRGTNANHTKVLIDGIEANDPSTPDGAFDFSQILANDIERVEVLRGPQSALYGSDAIGGVVNVITKKGKGPAKFTAGAEAGSFATFNQNAGVSGSKDRFTYAFNASHFRSAETPVTPNELVPTGRRRNKDLYDNKTISATLGAEIAQNFDLGFTGRYTFTKLESTADDFIGPENRNSSASNHNLYSRATAHAVSFDGRLDHTLGLAYTRYSRNSVDPNPTAFSAFNQYSGERIKADWVGNYTLMQGQVATLGLEHQEDSTDNLGFKEASINNNAGFVQLQSSFGERFFNTLSLRHDDNGKFGSKNTYRIAPAYLIPETATKLKASYGTGFKAPTLAQLYDDYPAFSFFANPNLQPETSKGYDIGFEQKLGKKFEFGSTFFHNDIKNLINSTFDPVTFNGTVINIGRATTRGFENYVSYKPWNTLQLRADYTYTLANDEVLKQQLLRRPKHKASISAAWQATDKLSLNTSAVHTGSFIDGNRDFSISRLKAEDYTVLNVSAEYALNENVSFTGRVDNVTNKHYQNPTGFENPGLGAYVGIKTNF